MPSPGALEALPTVPLKSTSQDGRIHGLDALRAGAMFLGIVLHVGTFYVVSAPVVVAGSDMAKHRLFDLLISAIHGFRVHLFFFLSGFFARLLFQRLGPKGFVKQRLQRVGLPFLLGMITVVPPVLGITAWAYP